MAAVQKILTIVVEASNQPPVAASDMPETFTLAVGATADLKPFFSDPDGDPLSFSLAEASELVDLSTDGVLTAKAVGSAPVTVVVDDGHA